MHLLGARHRIGFGLRASSVSVSALKAAAAAIRAASRQSCIPALPIMDGKGHWWLDRNRTQPFDPRVDLEKPVEWVDDLTGLPVGWELGPNVAVNGTFDVDANWTKGTGWTISGGAANKAPGTESYLSQTGVLTLQKLYQVTVAVASMSGGNLLVTAGTGGGSVVVSSAGTRTYYLTCSANTTLGLYGYAGTTAVIDNITVREVIRDESWLGVDVLAGRGSFSNPSDWSAPVAGASVTGGALAFDGVTSIGGGLQITAPSPAITLLANRSYQITYTIVSGTTLPISVGLTTGSILGTAQSAAGTYTEVLTPTSNANLQVLTRTSAGARTGSIDNISVKEVPGNNLVSPSAGTGPRATARVNLLQRTEDLTNSAWGSSGVSGFSANSIAAPDGTMTADLVQANAVNAAHFINFVATVGTAAPHVLSFWAKPGGQTRFGVREQATGSFQATFDLTGAGSVVAASGGTATVTAVADGWYRIVISLTLAAAAAFRFFVLPAAYTSGNLNTYFWTGDTVTGTYLWGFDFRLAIHTTAAYPAYQRVGDGTAGVFDYDATGFPVWPNNDATRALMTLGTVDMSGTSQAALMSVATKLSDAALSIVAETSVTANANGAMYLTAPRAAGLANYGALIAGSVNSAPVTTASSFPAPRIDSLLATGDIPGDMGVLHVSGVQAAVAAGELGTGNFGNHRLNFMGRDVATGSLRFVGRATPPALIDMSVIDLATAQAMLREYASSVGHTY